MIRPHRVLALTIIILIVSGHVTALLTNLELWPFSPYPMYSESRNQYTLVQLDLFAVPEGDPEREFVLWGESYYRPLTHYQTRYFLDSLNARGERERMMDVLAVTLGRYEALREQGDHDGPSIQALRLYRVTWPLDIDAAPAGEPSRKILIAEVRHESR